MKKHPFMMDMKQAHKMTVCIGIHVTELAEHVKALRKILKSSTEENFSYQYGSFIHMHMVTMTSQCGLVREFLRLMETASVVANRESKQQPTERKTR